jgi:hypothetical protein
MKNKQKIDYHSYFGIFVCYFLNTPLVYALLQIKKCTILESLLGVMIFWSVCFLLSSFMINYLESGNPFKLLKKIEYGKD